MEHKGNYILLTLLVIITLDIPMNQTKETNPNSDISGPTNSINI